MSSSPTAPEQPQRKTRAPAPTLTTQMFRIGEVARWPRNPKAHDLEGIIASMQKFGFVQTPAKDATTGRLYAGHGRDEALALMKARGLPPPKNIVEYKGDWWMPVLVGVSFKDEAEAEQYLVADNRLTEKGGWETDKLLEILKKQDATDLRVIGFDNDDMRDLLRQADKDLMRNTRGGEEGAGGKPAERVLPNLGSKFGEVYELGPHRLMCGTAENIDHLRKLIGDLKIQVLCTDPPYNIAAENKGIAADVSASHKELMESEWDGGNDAEPFDPAKSFPLMLDFLADDCSVYIFTAHHLFGWYCDFLKKWTDHNSYCVWSKPDPMPSLMKRHWTWDTELVCYGTRGKHTFNFPDGEHAPSTWRISKSVENRIHPTQKPVEAFQHPFRHSALPGFVVADFFAGSGSSLIAADRLNLRGLFMEKDPRRCDLIRQRWADYLATKGAE